MKELLIKLDACKEAKDWAADKSWEEVYNTCHRGEWLLWLFERTNSNDLQLLTLAKGHCANTVRHLMTDERSIKAVDAAIAFGEGKIGKKELDEAARAAYYAAADAADAAARAADTAFAAADAASYAATAAYAAFATYAAYAARAAFAAADAAARAADTAFAAADADAASYAATAAAAAGYEENRKLTADICRKYLPIEVWNIKL